MRLILLFSFLLTFSINAFSEDTLQINGLSFAPNMIEVNGLNEYVRLDGVCKTKNGLVMISVNGSVESNTPCINNIWVSAIVPYEWYEGTHEITALQKDIVVGRKWFVVDKTPPQIFVSSGSIPVVFSNIHSYEISGTCSMFEDVYIRVEYRDPHLGIGHTLCQNGAWTVSVNLDKQFLESSNGSLIIFSTDSHINSTRTELKLVFYLDPVQAP